MYFCFLNFIPNTQKKKMLFLVTYNKDFSQITFYYVLCDH